MALIACHECGNQVSSSVKACPQCGAKWKALTGPLAKKKTGLLGKLIIGFIGLSLFGAMVGVIANPKGTAVPEPQEAKHDPNSERDTNILLYAKSLKAALRNPDSLVFEQVLASDDGKITCFKYRAENGFGGTNREWVAFSPAGGQNEGSAVKIICRDKGMKNVTDVALPLIKLLG